MLSISRDIYKKKPTNRLRPDFIAFSVQDIDFAMLKRYGIKTCFIDLDNTVVERADYTVSPDIKNALKNSGLDIYIATNRPKSRDLKDLKESLGAAGVIHPHGLMGKPTKTYFINGLKDKSLDRSTVVMIGDRYIQDILGANRSGIYSLVVHKFGKSVGRIDTLISGVERWWTAHISKKYISK